MTQPVHAGTYLIRAEGNPFYRKALEACPGYVQAGELRSRAMERQRALQFPQVQYPDPPTTVDADLDGYIDAFTAARAEDEARARGLDAITSVIGACERTISGAVSQPDPLLKSLAADFDDFLTRAKSTDAELKGAATASEAIALGTANAWRDLTELRTEYDTLRDAQEKVMVGGFITLGQYRSDHIDDPLASDTHLRDLDDVFPAWRERDQRMILQGTPPDRRPWPTDPVEQLVWMIRHATPWIPTTRQLDALHEERARRLNPMPDVEPKNMIITPNAAANTRKRAAVIQ